jgi:hypothetical protein
VNHCQGLDATGNRLVADNPGYRDLRVMNAVWGYQNQAWNVTGQLNNMVRGGRLSFKVNTTNLEGDPAQGRVKTLKLYWLANGRHYQHTYREGDFVNLP